MFARCQSCLFLALHLLTSSLGFTSHWADRLAIVETTRAWHTTRHQQWLRVLPEVKKLVESQSLVTIIEVGANDGDLENGYDPVQSVLNQTNVRAFLLEPNPSVFKTLQHNVQKKFKGSAGRIQPLEYAISPESSGEISFFIMSKQFAIDFPEAPHWMKYQISSMNKEKLLEHKEIRDKFTQYIEEIKVPSKTPSDFLKMVNLKPQMVDILLVDSEGFDDQIVKAFVDVAKFRPKVLIYEYCHLSVQKKAEAKETLRSLGYDVVEADYWNAVATRKS